MRHRLLPLLLCIVAVFVATQGSAAGQGKGVIAGKVLMPRDIATEAHNYWQNYELTKAVAVALAESTGALGAYHDNYADVTNTILASRDCGLYQINIPAKYVGTPYEDALRTTSLLPSDWTPVLQVNVARAYALYTTPWTSTRTRHWQPWVAYTTGWATFPEFWVWHQDAEANPVGPWIATGRYIQRAIAGQMNYHIVTLKDWTPEQALSYAHRYTAHFNVKDTLYINSQHILTWKVPSRPTAPPADGVGPRPLANDGL